MNKRKSRTARQVTGPGSESRPPRGLTDRIVWRPVDDLTEFPGNPRRHPEGQIASLMKSIQRVWTNPILIDETCTILAGHGRLEAAKRLGMSEVPTVMLSGLSATEKKAIVIADNRLPERAVWDFDLLRCHFRQLIELDFDVELTGFSTGEVDLLMDSTAKCAAVDPADDLTGFTLDGPAVCQAGDVWELGRHRLICGDALQAETYQRLLQGELAQMVVTDPPTTCASMDMQDGLGRNVRNGVHPVPRKVHSPDHQLQPRWIDPLCLYGLAPSP
jgi:ParB-like chromosome segregation protein Spo0J